MENNRDNYQWRPNDNSVTTQTRYDLEIEHYIRSIKSAQIDANTTSVGGSVTFIVTLIKFIFNLIHLIVLIIIDAVKWIRNALPKKKDPLDGVPHFDNKPPLSDEEAMALIKKAKESGVITEIDLS